MMIIKCPELDDYILHNINCNDGGALVLAITGGIYFTFYITCKVADQRLIYLICDRTGSFAVTPSTPLAQLLRILI